jgi:hypothetical protein
MAPQQLLSRLHWQQTQIQQVALHQTIAWERPRRHPQRMSWVWSFFVTVELIFQPPRCLRHGPSAGMISAAGKGSAVMSGSSTPCPQEKKMPVQPMSQPLARCWVQQS